MKTYIFQCAWLKYTSFAECEDEAWKDLEDMIYWSADKHLELPSRNHWMLVTSF